MGFVSWRSKNVFHPGVVTVRITRKMRDCAVDLLRKEQPTGIIQGVDVESLAKMLTTLKAADKPRIILKGCLIVAFHQDETGEISADLLTDCFTGKGKPFIPSAEFAEWMLNRAAETAKTSLPSEADKG